MNPEAKTLTNTKGTPEGLLDYRQIITDFIPWRRYYLVPIHIYVPSMVTTPQETSTSALKKDN